jgi:hypothetical protein
MTLLRRMTLVGILVFAVGPLASSALAVGPATDCATVVPYAKIEQHFGLPKVAVTSRVPYSEKAGLDSSLCAVVVYRGRKVRAGEWGGPIRAGRAVGLVVRTGAQVASGCVEEPPGFREGMGCPQSAEESFHEGLAETIRLADLGENSALALPTFGAEAVHGRILCRQKVCQVIGIWWRAPTRAQLYMELSTSQRRGVAIKSLNTLAAPATRVYFA